MKLCEGECPPIQWVVGDRPSVPTLVAMTEMTEETAWVDVVWVLERHLGLAFRAGYETRQENPEIDEADEIDRLRALLIEERGLVREALRATGTPAQDKHLARIPLPEELDS